MEKNQIGDGKHTINECAVFHVDSCYEASSGFDRDCMIRCVEVGYEAYELNQSSELTQLKAENERLRENVITDNIAFMIIFLFGLCLGFGIAVITNP